MSLLLCAMKPPSGGGGLTAPTYEDVATSGSNSALTTQTIDTPAYASGNVIVIGYSVDGNPSTRFPGSVTNNSDVAAGPNSETLTIHSESASGDATSVAGGLASYTSTGSITAGANLKLVILASDQTAHVVAEFSGSNGIADISAWGSGSGPTVTSPATTATNANGIVCSLIAIDRVVMSSAASGWTIIDQIDVGAASVCLVRRTALTTASESVATAAHTASDSEEYVAITFVVEGS